MTDSAKPVDRALAGSARESAVNMVGRIAASAALSPKRAATATPTEGATASRATNSAATTATMRMNRGTRAGS